MTLGVFLLVLAAAVCHAGWNFVTRKVSGNLVVLWLAIGAGSMGTYLMILFAFTLGLVSYVVAIREFAVVIGALFGTVFLKEKLTHSKVLAIITITMGLVCVKAG